MRIYGFEEILSEHPVFKDFDEDTIALLAGCARNEHFKAGTMVFREGGPADRFYIIRQGDVAIEIVAPERDPLVIQTAHAGDVLGWSWLVPPYVHYADARAVTDVRAVSLDAVCMRGKCEDNPVLGYHMFQHWSPLIAARVRMLSMQLLDVYGTNER